MQLDILHWIFIMWLIFIIILMGITAFFLRKQLKEFMMMKFFPRGHIKAYFLYPNRQLETVSLFRTINNTVVYKGCEYMCDAARILFINSIPVMMFHAGITNAIQLYDNKNNKINIDNDAQSVKTVMTNKIIRDMAKENFDRMIIIILLAVILLAVIGVILMQLGVFDQFLSKYAAERAAK